jgi:hypothetical protein
MVVAVVPEARGGRASGVSGRRSRRTCQTAAVRIACIFSTVLRMTKITLATIRKFTSAFATTGTS